MKRIETLASLTKGSQIVCDIGCDHAYVLIHAIKSYGVTYGYALDIAEGPLENAKKTIQSYGLEGKIEAILSDGFEKMKDEFDTAIIAGMGGSLICDILSRGLEKIQKKKLIIEANCDAYRVREYLFSKGFVITEEVALFEASKYYELMVFEPGNSKMDFYDIKYGPLLRRNQPEAFRNFYGKKRQLIGSILKQITDTSKEREKLNLYHELDLLLKEKNMEKHFILNTTNYYRTYFLDEEPRPTILVSPGGAYKYTSPRESEPVVEAFQSYGYHVVVVNYRETFEDAYPLPQKYLAEAICQIQQDKRVKKLIGLGFSAGGHCLLEVMLHRKYYNLEPLDLLMLGYPVITTDKTYAHLASFENLLKENSEDESLRSYLSLEKQVNKENAIDLFLWGTLTDESVSVENSLKLIEAYHAVNVNVEYHLFPLGGHGLSVATSATKDIPYIHRWVDFAHQWIEFKLKQ